MSWAKYCPRQRNYKAEGQRIKQSCKDLVFLTKTTLKNRKTKSEKPNLSVAQDSAVINRSEIRLEQPPVPLSGRAGFLVLIEQRKYVSLEPAVGQQGRALPRLHVPHQLGIIRRRIGDATHGAVIAVGGPAGLAQGDVDVSEAEGLGGGVNGVDERVELVGVSEARVGVMEAGVGLEDGEVEAFGVEVEVRVGVDHEGGLGFGQELQHWAQYVLGEAWPELARTWRCGYLHDRQRVCGGHLNNLTAINTHFNVNMAKKYEEILKKKTRIGFNLGMINISIFEFVESHREASLYSLCEFVELGRKD